MASNDLMDILGAANKNADMSEQDKQSLAFVLDSSTNFKNEIVEQEKKREEEQAAAAARQEMIDGLEENQFLLSSVTNGRLPESGEDRIFTKFDSEYFPEEVRVDIPTVDEEYYWDADLLEAMWLGYYMNQRTLMVGPPGTGKTTATQQLAALIRQPFARFNGKDGIEASSFLGYPWATSGGMEWKDGLMPQCVQNDYMVVIDEVMKLPPGIQMALQSLYEVGGFLMLDDKPGTIADKHIHPSQNFRLFATDNTKGTGDSLDKYAAGQFQDVSSLDRFGITVEVDYLKRETEVEMLQQKFPAANVRDIKRVVALASLVREAFKQGNIAVTLSPRGLQVILELMQMKVSLETASQLSFINKLGDDREIELANKFLKDCS